MSFVRFSKEGCVPSIPSFRVGHVANSYRASSGALRDVVCQKREGSLTIDECNAGTVAGVLDSTKIVLQKQLTCFAGDVDYCDAFADATGFWMNNHRMHKSCHGEVV